jgi:site-specific recombinase XerD
MGRSPYSISLSSAVAAPRIHRKRRTSHRSLHPGLAVPARPENLSRLDELQQDFSAFIDRAKYVQRYSPFSVTWFENGYANYRAYLDAGADLAPEDFVLRMNTLSQWIAWNTARGLAEITMNGYWRSVRTFFNDRTATKNVPNPFVGLRPPKTGTPAPKARSPHDCAAILHAARNYPWATSLQRELALAVLATMLYAGLRKSELFRLTNADVDLIDGTIKIIKGKGRYGGKDRTALMAPDLVRILRSYVAARDRAKFKAVAFFVSAVKGHPLSEGVLRDIVRKVSRASGVPFSPHVLRHSFVTQLIRTGVPLAIVRDLAGHANIETTLGYTTIFDEDRQREIRKLHFSA